MKQGDKVRVISNVIPGVWLKPREMVFTFISKDEHEWVFSARPEAGTQVMPVAHVRSVTRVADATPIMMPRIIR